VITDLADVVRTQWMEEEDYRRVHDLPSETIRGYQKDVVTTGSVRALKDEDSA
jgi:hypothetical protein